MQANRYSAPWLVRATASVRAQRWTSILALLSAIFPGCVSGSLDVPATESAGGSAAAGNRGIFYSDSFF